VGSGRGEGSARPVASCSASPAGMRWPRPRRQRRGHRGRADAFDARRHDPVVARIEVMCLALLLRKAAVVPVAAPTGPEQLAPLPGPVKLRPPCGEVDPALPGQVVALAPRRPGEQLVPAAVARVAALRDVPLARVLQGVSRRRHQLAPHRDARVDVRVQRHGVEDVVVDAVAARVEAGHVGGSRGAAVSRGRVAPAEAETIRGEALGVRHVGFRARVGRQAGHLVIHEDEDVRALRGHGLIFPSRLGIGARRQPRCRHQGRGRSGPAQQIAASE